MFSLCRALSRIKPRILRIPPYKSRTNLFPLQPNGHPGSISKSQPGIPRYYPRPRIPFLKIIDQEPPSPDSRNHLNNYNVANAITFGRILCAPVATHFILTSSYDYALYTLFYAAISDFLDGHIARYYNLQTPLGSLLDPAADKLLITTTTVALAYQHILPPWLAVVIVARDILLVTGWLVLNPSKLCTFAKVPSKPLPPIRPLLISKINTTLQITLTFTAILSASNSTLLPTATLDLLSFATAFTTTTSGIAYAKRLYPPSRPA